MATTEHADPPFVTSRLVRPHRDRVVGGVAAGLGDHFGLEPLIFRVVFVVLTLAGGSGVALYGLAWLLIPEECSPRSPGADLLDRIERREQLPVAALVVSALCAFFLLRGLSRPFRVGPPLLLPLALAGLVAVAILRFHGRFFGSRERIPGVTPWWLWTVGGVLVVLGGLQVVLGWSWGWVALGVLVTGGVVLAVAGRRWLAAGALLVLLAGTLTGATWQLGVGDRTYQPDATLSGQHGYHLGAGRLTVDLSGLAVAGLHAGASVAPPDVDASVGVGQVVVVVPEGMSARVDGSAGVGDVIIFGQRSDGTGVRRVGGSGASDGSLRIHTKVGIGEVVVEAQPVAGG